MKANIKSTIMRIDLLTQGEVFECTKLPMRNIVIPPFTDFAILGELIRQVVRTKEQPQGHLYDEEEYQMVLRVVDGHLLMHGQYDSYCWKQTKVANLLTNYEEIPRIGFNDPTGKAAIRWKEIADTIKDPKELAKFAQMFSQSKFDYLLLDTPAEHRLAVEVSAKMWDAGLQYVIDDWMYEPGFSDDEEAEVTNLSIGDYLIKTDKGYYCIRKDEFEHTHVFKPFVTIQ